MDFVLKERLRRYWPWGAGALGIAVVGTVFTVLSLAATTNSSVDFTKSIMSLAAKPFSSTISTYAEGGKSIITSSEQRTSLASLKAGYYRVPLQWNNGNIISSAGGHPEGSGDNWVSSIKALGAAPQVVVGGSEDNNFTPQDAANLVKHFNKPASGVANRVDVWIIGNEPGSGMSIQAYCSLFNSSVEAMRVVDPTIKIAGPAWAYFDIGTLRTFLQCAGDKVDIIDYHHYGMGVSFLSEAEALSQTGNWESEVQQTKQAIKDIVPSRANQIEVQVGEYNWSWRTENGYNGWQGDDRFYQAVNTVWGASVAGHIAKAGGRGHQYADLNGALGLTFEKNDAASHHGRKLTDPMPIYYGMEMFTGGNLFRGFGSTVVEANTSLNNVEIFASSGQKNIVAINKDPNTSQTASIKLTGFAGGKADVWQTNKNAPFDAPARKATLTNITDVVEYVLPPYSVTTIVLDETTTGGGTTPTTPSPTPVPSKPPTAPIRINAGGGQYTDSAKNLWSADYGATGGVTDDQAKGRQIAGTNDMPIYQDERWGNFSYRIPISRGTYKVRLHFAEIYSGCQQPGCRVFNISANGVSWLTNYDIAAKAGANKAVVEEKTITLDQDALDLVFTGVVGSPQLAAIEILAPSTTTPAPVPTPTPSPTPGTPTGLSALYFSNKTLSGNGIARTDQTIDFNWGSKAPANNVPANQFSARWTGGITASKSGTYTFYLSGDDGVRMWLDGKQVINGWVDQSGREYRASVALTANRTYDIKIEYYENYGNASIHFAWSGPNGTKQTVPAGVLSPIAVGLHATYYVYKGGGAFGNVLYEGTDRTIDFNWGSGQPNSLVPKDRFGVVWTGKITAPVTGQYTFATQSDDGVRLTVNDQAVIDDWIDHGVKQNSGTVTLTANQTYTIKVSYYENYGNAVMRLLWKTPGQGTMVAVPASVLSN